VGAIQTEHWFSKRAISFSLKVYPSKFDIYYFYPSTQKPNMKWIAYALCLLTAFSGFAGCSGLFRTLERPRINIANVTAKEIKLFEQVFALELRIQNPNDLPLEINGLAFELEVNGKRFATGVSKQKVTVDRLSSAVIHVEAMTTLWFFLRQIAEYQQTRTPRVTYRMKGTIYSGSPSVRLPFDDGGEFNIPIEPTQ
jgi:LEA14-like dessication related protein